MNRGSDIISCMVEMTFCSVLSNTLPLAFFSFQTMHSVMRASGGFSALCMCVGMNLDVHCVSCLSVSMRESRESVFWHHGTVRADGRVFLCCFNVYK